jgi:hypothetical protein
MAATKLQKGSSLAKQAGYTGAVKVGSESIQGGGNQEESKCPRCEEEITLKLSKRHFRFILIKKISGQKLFQV